MPSFEHIQNAADSFDDPHCSECGNPCVPTPYDAGIGPYEYWGYQQVHQDWRVASACCDVDVVERFDLTMEVDGDE